MIQLALHCTNLQYLTLYMIEDVVTVAAIQALVEHAVNLTTLHLGVCSVDKIAAIEELMVRNVMRNKTVRVVYTIEETSSEVALEVVPEVVPEWSTEEESEQDLTIHAHVSNIRVPCCVLIGAFLAVYHKNASQSSRQYILLIMVVSAQL